MVTIINDLEIVNGKLTLNIDTISGLLSTYDSSTTLVVNVLFNGSSNKSIRYTNEDTSDNISDYVTESDSKCISLEPPNSSDNNESYYILTFDFSSLCDNSDYCTEDFTTNQDHYFSISVKQELSPLNDVVVLCGMLKLIKV